MNTFKCRQCGKPLSFDSNLSVYVCENCNIPRLRSLPENKRSVTAKKHEVYDCKASLSQAYKSLQYGLFLKADKLFDDVLKQEPNNAQAYIGKLLAACQCRSTASLAVCDPGFGDSEYFKQAMRCADPQTQAELKGFLQAAVDLQSVKAGETPSAEVKPYTAEAQQQQQTKKAAASVSWKQKLSGLLKHRCAKYYLGAALFVLAIPSGMLVGSPLSCDRDYRAAKQYMNAGNYEQAISAFSDLENYKDSPSLVEQCRYEYGRALQEAKHFGKAKTQFDIIAGYSDSSQRSQECQISIEKMYQEALSLMQKQEWQTAKQILEDTGDYRDSRELSAKCGSGILLEQIGRLPAGHVFYLGTYTEKDGEPPKPIAWRILRSDAEEMLAISLCGIEYLAYSDSAEGQNWRYSSLRKWLNGAFIQEAFTGEERCCIADSHVITPANPQSKMPGCETWDKVFLLSADEAERYFSDDDDRVCQATDYADRLSDWHYADNTNWWWLRSPGRSPLYASVVNQEGAVDCLSFQETVNRGMVRPAIRLKRIKK